jgi:hypothetical protein
MSEEWLGILSIAILFVTIFIGFPIAFTLIAVALGVGYIALGPIALHLMTLQFFAVMKETSLASVPFFLFMGYLLEQSRLMERLFRGIQQLLAGVRDHGGRHARHSHSAVRDADRDGAGRGRADHGSVRRGDPPRSRAFGPVHHLLPRPQLPEPGARPRPDPG